MGFPDVPQMLHREMGSVLLHWVVQRNAQTGVLITFVSFEDHADAESHEAKVEAIADPLGRTNAVTIESLPIAEFPKLETGAASARASPSFEQMRGPTMAKGVRGDAFGDAVIQPR